METALRSNRGKRRSQSATRRTWRVAVATIVIATLAAGAGQDEKKSSTTEPKTTVLFDGKTLDGWKKTDFFNSGEVKVESDAIVMSTGRSMTGITSTHNDLPTTNYELTYEAERRSGSDFFAAATFPVGKSFITLVNGGWGGNVTGLSSLDGADASENETTELVKYKNNTWYKFRVRVTDTTIRCHIDGKEIVAINFEGRQVGTRIETRRNQPLGFATYESTGALRNIRIRPLTAAEITATNKAKD
jgi:hypothetical protein